MRRSVVLATIVIVGLSVSWIYGAPQGTPPAALNPDNFTGVVTPHATADIRTLRYEFVAGARTNWHSHAGGQVIFIELGRMRAQEKGQAIKELPSGSVMRTEPNIVHWHGAVSSERMRQVSLSFGVTNWMGKVTDEEYAGTRR
jgi:quercetin dioxygenase-like cupin family protein